jgi:hypothetical protein
MAMQSSVVRISRVRQKIRTDLWPDAPQIPDTMVKRFPELAQFNEDLRLFVERIRNATEPDPEQFTDSSGCEP